MCGYKTNKKKYVVAKQMGQTCLPPLQWNYRLCWGQTKSSFFCQLDYLQAQVCSQTQLPLKSTDIGTCSRNKLNLQLR